MKRLALATLLLILCTAATNTLTERQRALHALNRLGFGARPGDVERVMHLGVDRWIAQQLQPSRIDDRAVDARLASYETLTMSDAQLLAMRSSSRKIVEELTSQRIIRAVESERQLEEVMADFWLNHFNVFAGKGIDRFLLTSYERDVIRPHMWGRFEDLLLATAKSPAMLFYLDNARSRRGGINENYARELMELHTLGVDGGYTQKDVTELARVLTGWSIVRPQEGPTAFVFRRFAHDRDAKTVLGVRIAAGGGIEEGERMIRHLARHPSTAKHIATKLAQRLVADEPPPALVARVAKRFTETSGDLRATVKAVIDSPEFWDAKHYRAKVKTPFEYTVSAIRALGARVDNPLPIARELRKIGQPLYFAQPPTGWSDKADAWVNSGALISRLNFAIALAANKMPGVRVDLARFDATNVDTLAQSLTGGELSKETRATVASRATEPQMAAALILGSPEFQRQ